jgi:acyl dehydratase
MAGLFFDELRVGQLSRHEIIPRAITETDSVWFSDITQNPDYLRVDEECCRIETEYGQRMVNSGFALALIVGILVGETTLGTAVDNLGRDGVRLPRPRFHDDTARVKTKVVDLRESKSRSDQGIVMFLRRAYRQKNELVAHGKRSGLQRNKPKA